MQNKKYVVITVSLLLLFGAALSGCSESNDRENGGGDDTTSSAIDDASSIKYKWSYEDNQESGTWTYLAKDIDTDDLKIKIEYTNVEDKSGGIVINEEQEKAWEIKDNGDWDQYTAMEYDYIVNQFVPSFNSHLERLHNNWDGEPYEYTNPSTGESFEWHAVEVNPSLSDSIFEE